jgi:hypothetical protein
MRRICPRRGARRSEKDKLHTEMTTLERAESLLHVQPEYNLICVNFNHLIGRCRTIQHPPCLRFVASTSSALPRLCPGASCASSNREFVLKKLCPKSPWVYSLSFAYIQLCPKSPWVYSPSFAAAAAAAAAPAGPAAPADLADIVGSRPTAAQSNIRRHPATTKLG